MGCAIANSQVYRDCFGDESSGSEEQSRSNSSSSDSSDGSDGDTPLEHEGTPAVRTLKKDMMHPLRAAVEAVQLGRDLPTPDVGTTRARATALSADHGTGNMLDLMASPPLPLRTRARAPLSERLNDYL